MDVNKNNTCEKLVGKAFNLLINYAILEISYA